MVWSAQILSLWTDKFMKNWKRGEVHKLYSHINVYAVQSLGGGKW